MAVDDFLSYCDTEDTTPSHETVVLYKKDAISIIAAAWHAEGGEILLWDSRNPVANHKGFDTAQETQDVFRYALTTSTARGWRIAHRGKPNEG